MKIEPCPLCGYPCGISDDDVVSCTNCSYRYDSDYALGVHNCLSRIVRAAEAWAKARRSGTMLEISDAANAVLVAVEGGRSDGATV